MSGFLASEKPKTIFQNDSFEAELRTTLDKVRVLDSFSQLFWVVVFLWAPFIVGVEYVAVWTASTRRWRSRLSKNTFRFDLVSFRHSLHGVRAFSGENPKSFVFIFPLRSSNKRLCVISKKLKIGNRPCLIFSLTSEKYRTHSYLSKGHFSWILRFCWRSFEFLNKEMKIFCSLRDIFFAPLAK